MADSPQSPRPVVGDAAKAVLLRARDLARASADGHLHSLHLLAALAEAPAVADLLARFEVEAAQVETRIRTLRWAGAKGEDAVEERAVEDARREARDLGDAEVVPAHLLVALARREGSAASEVLGSVGVTADDLVGSIRFARGELGDWVPGARPRAGGDEALAQVERWEEVQRQVGSPLRRVIGVGRAATAGGVTVELLAIELREAVMLVHWRAATGSDALLGMPEFDVRDSGGRAYQCWGASGGGGSGEFRGYTLAVPPAPDEGTLVVEFTSFGRADWAAHLPDEALRRGIAGPWRFEVELGA